MLFYMNIFLYLTFIISVGISYQYEYSNFGPITINPMVYHFLLKDEHHYVGITYNLNQEYSLHSNGKGNDWTRQYSPISIEKVWSQGSTELVNKVTLDLIYLYGKEKVRGGKYMDFQVINNEINNEYRVGDEVLIPREYCPFTEVNTLVVNHLHYIIATVIDVNKYLLTYQYKIEETINSTSFYTDRIGINNLYKYQNMDLDKIMKFREINWVQSILKKMKFKQNYEILYIDKSWFCKYNKTYTLVEYDKSLSYSGIINAGKCTYEIEKIAILYKIYRGDFRIYNEKIENKEIFWQLLLL